MTNGKGLVNLTIIIFQIVLVLLGKIKAKATNFV